MEIELKNAYRLLLIAVVISISGNLFWIISGGKGFVIGNMQTIAAGGIMAMAMSYYETKLGIKWREN